MAPLRLDQVVLKAKFVHQVLQACEGNNNRGKKVDDCVLGAVRCLLCSFPRNEHKKSCLAQITDISRPQGLVDGQHGCVEDVPETLMAWAVRYMAIFAALGDGS